MPYESYKESEEESICAMYREMNMYDRIAMWIELFLIISMIGSIAMVLHDRAGLLFVGMYITMAVMTMIAVGYNFDKWSREYDKEKFSIDEYDDLISKRDINNFIGYPDPEEQLGLIYEKIRRRETRRHSNTYRRFESEKDYNEIIEDIKTLSMNPHL